MQIVNCFRYNFTPCFWRSEGPWNGWPDFFVLFVVCPDNFYGENCTETCQCLNNAVCDSQTGLAYCCIIFSNFLIKRLTFSVNILLSFLVRTSFFQVFLDFS